MWTSNFELTWEIDPNNKNKIIEKIKTELAPKVFQETYAKETQFIYSVVN